MFRTTINSIEYPFKIDYSHKIMMIGSCFTENMGYLLKDLKFQVLINPCGIIYNPASVAETVNILLQGKVFEKNELTFSDELFFHFLFHGSFSDLDAQKCLKKINSSVERAQKFLCHSDYLFITFGTAWVYELKKTGKIVANCHKQPSELFNRFRMTVGDITSQYDILFKNIFDANPDLKIIFTVSPVRHLKDGFIENQLSKSTLLVAIHQLCEKWKEVYYFPSYEIMMDDLRDYRFYNDDMIHPSALAIKYIWQHFSDSFFTGQTKEIIKAVENVINAYSHNLLHSQTNAAKNFAKQMLEQISELELKLPFADFKEQRNYFNLILQNE